MLAMIEMLFTVYLVYGIGCLFYYSLRYGIHVLKSPIKLVHGLFSDDTQLRNKSAFFIAVVIIGAIAGLLISFAMKP